MLATDSSNVYARNILALVMDVVDKNEGGAIKLDLEDEVIDGALIIQDGEVRHGPTREAIENRGVSTS